MINGSGSVIEVAGSLGLSWTSLLSSTIPPMLYSTTYNNLILQSPIPTFGTVTVNIACNQGNRIDIYITRHIYNITYLDNVFR